jgi:glycosyltransferase involved in cell wall biosynthesis
MPSSGTWRRDEPLVTYLISTYNRRHYLAQALKSALQQTHRNLQIIVVRDGGDEVRDIVKSFGDERLLLLDRPRNRGLAYSYNEAIPYARGKYIAYLGDDDFHYPHHIETHVRALESNPRYQASFSQLYRTMTLPLPGGKRKTLAKSVIIARDYEPIYELHYNLVLGGAAVHRRDLLEKTGPYNESIRVLIDWDMMRRISFFTPFLSLHDITGEFFTYLEGNDTDRISDKGRRDKLKYFQNCIAIKNNRPPKPWKTYKDLSIVFTPTQVNEQTLTRLVNILQYTFTPHEVYLPLTPGEIQQLNVSMPIVKPIPVAEGLTPAQRFDAALEHVEGDYVCYAPDRVRVAHKWVEEALFPLVELGEGHGMEIRRDDEEGYGVILPVADMKRIRRQYPNLSVRRSIQTSELPVRLPRPGEEEIFPLDVGLNTVLLNVKNGNYVEAADGFLDMTGRGNELWMKCCAAWALYHDGTRDDRAIALCEELRRDRPWVDALQVHGKLLRRVGRYEEAVEVLEEARRIIDVTVTV